MQEKRKRVCPRKSSCEGIKTADILALWKHGKRVTDVAGRTRIPVITRGTRAQSGRACINLWRN